MKARCAVNARWLRAVNSSSDLILDGTKIAWHQDRVRAWQRGERIAPITIDMALTRQCQMACGFCYASLQGQMSGSTITKDVIETFLADAAEVGVKGISLVSDGESTVSPVFVDTIVKGHELGLSMAVGSNALTLTRPKLEKILPALTYLRVNISAGERDRYAEIMGAKKSWFDRVCQNIRDMVEIKRRDGLPVTLGMQMVLMPQYGDQILPLARLGAELGVDYLVIKHCSDDEDGHLGVDYSAYAKLYDLLYEAERYSSDRYKVHVKWSKIEAGRKRRYQRCYGPPFMLQISGSGLIAPCGATFNEKWKKLHLGNICTDRFRDIIKSDHYWNVMHYLASPKFNAQTMCGSLCLQDKVNQALDDHVKGTHLPDVSRARRPEHVNFI